MTFASDFADAIERAGLTPPPEVVADGALHRFRSGDERARNGFYRLSVLPARGGGEVAFGFVGCWKRGIRERWSSRGEAEIGALKHAQAEVGRKDAEKAQKAAAKAEGIWRNAFPADPRHPYLVAKGIGAHRLRQYRGSLVVPVRRGGELVSLQFIFPDGEKRFLSGGRVEGGYAMIPGTGDLILAEGFATAASVHEATGQPVAAAFHAGNLAAVAIALRPRVIAADNDRFTTINGQPRNVGVEYATAAAESVGATVAIPPFAGDDPERLSDWNDYRAKHGAHAMREAFRRARDSGPRINSP